MSFNRRWGAQRGQAMIETIIIVTLVGIAAGFALRELGVGFGERQKNLESYYSLPFP